MRPGYIISNVLAIVARSKAAGIEHTKSSSNEINTTLRTFFLTAASTGAAISAAISFFFPIPLYLNLTVAEKSLRVRKTSFLISPT